MKKYVYILALEIAGPRNQHCANCIGTLSFLVAATRFSMRTLTFPQHCVILHSVQKCSYDVLLSDAITCSWLITDLLKNMYCDKMVEYK